MNVHFWWYLSRGAGIASWLCGGLGLALGLSLTSKATLKPRPNWQLAVHRHLAMLTMTALGAHVGAIVLDGYTAFGLADVTLPFHSAWNPAAVASGVVAMWFLIAVQLTSLARRHLPKRLWQLVHRTSIVAYVLATVHLLQAGSERHNPLLLSAVLVLSAVNLVLLTFRVVADGRPPRTTLRAAEPDSGLLPSAQRGAAECKNAGHAVAGHRG